MALRQRHQSKFGCVPGPMPAQRCPASSRSISGRSCRFNCRRDSPMWQSPDGTAGGVVLMNVRRIIVGPRFIHSRSNRYTSVRSTVSVGHPLCSLFLHREPLSICPYIATCSSVIRHAGLRARGNHGRLHIPGKGLTSRGFVGHLKP